MATLAFAAAITPFLIQRSYGREIGLRCEASEVVLSGNISQDTEGSADGRVRKLIVDLVFVGDMSFPSHHIVIIRILTTESIDWLYLITESPNGGGKLVASKFGHEKPDGLISPTLAVSVIQRNSVSLMGIHDGIVYPS